MMKRILLASAVLMSTPAFAQDATPSQTTAPTTQNAPATPTTTPPEEASDVIGTPQTTQATPAQTTADAGQPATGTQIAQIVEAEFPKYDKDGKGQLTETQFGEWMVALRSASEPGVTPDKPEVRAWVKQAFASADADRSKAVSKAELTRFLTQNA